MKVMQPWLRWNLWITDLGFVVYWLIVALGLLPSELAFKDYNNPVMQSWNWSFFPIDILASVLGFIAIRQHRQGHATWPMVATASLALTFCAGIFAIAFWTLQGDYSFEWWAPNLYLIIWPLFAFYALLRPSKTSEAHV